MKISRILNGNIIIVGCLKDFKNPPNPLARIFANSTKKIDIKAIPTVMFRSFVGCANPNSGNRFITAMNITRNMKYGTYPLAFGPTRRPKNPLNFSCAHSNASCPFPGFSTLSFLVARSIKTMITAMAIHITTSDSWILIPPPIGTVNNVFTSRPAEISS